jgi:hypothetical protein
MRTSHIEYNRALGKDMTIADVMGRGTKPCSSPRGS